MNDFQKLNNITLEAKKQSPIVVYEEELAKFKALFSLLTVIIDKQSHRVLYESETYTASFAKYGKDVIAQIIDQKVHDLKRDQFEFSFVFEGIRSDYAIDIKDIVFHERDVYLGIIRELGHFSASQTTDEKITRISNALLKIVSSVDIGEDISKTLDLILTQSIKGFEHGHFGSVFVVQDDLFKALSDIGFSSEINDFKLPITDSFLYMATQGKMDRITMMNDVQSNFKVLPVKTAIGTSADIQSSIVAPIYYRGSLYGMMSIDSSLKDAFNQDDLAVMTFIRDNVQVIISNQLTFLERTNQALTDHMTGLYNRHFLVEHFNTILERAKRYEESFCVIVFDLDDLKLINDRYGHLVGDQLIKAFAKTLHQNSRRSDILARFGGDEFVAILLTDNETEINRRIRAFDRHFSVKTDEHTTLELDYQFSYGIAVYPKDADNYADLINQADARMYHNKIENKIKKKE